MYPNDLTIGCQNLNPLSHPNATLAPQTRQARASGENMNYVTLVPQVRQVRPGGEILNYSLSHKSDILVKIIDYNKTVSSSCIAVVLK